MAVYYVTLLVIVLLGVGVLYVVGLASIGRRRGEQTRLSSAMQALVDHLNGDAAPPPAIAELFAPLAGRPDRRTSEEMTEVLDEQLPVAEAERHPAGVAEHTVGTVREELAA